MWGGKREGAGRPKQERTRKMRSMLAYDEEWEIIKEFAKILKSGKIEECSQFVRENNSV